MNEKYVVAYPNAAFKKDESNFSKSINENKIDWSSFSRLMIHDLAYNSNILNDNTINGELTIDEINCALRYPRTNWKVLLKLSEELMRISPHYYRLNMLYSNMAMFLWGVDLYGVKPNANIDSIKTAYSNLVDRLELMNLKHEFSKIMRVLPYKDIYCGLIYEDSHDFFITEIDFNLCKLNRIDDGIFTFSIDLSKINPLNIDCYPNYVIKAYTNYKNKMVNKGGYIDKWYTPPLNKQICIKMNYQWLYPYPFLISLIKDLINLDTYKNLKLQSARTDNYKAILVKVPIDESTVDKPLLTPETLGVFAEINRESMNDDIGIIHTLGSSGQAISFKDSSNTRNNVSDAVDEIYNSAGSTRELFNGSSTGTALTISVENDSSMLYGIYRQFERWVNRWIKSKKYNKQLYKFNFYLLDITIFNKEDITTKYKDACALGVTVIDKWVAALGITPSRLLGSYILHNDIFDFINNFKPLQTSYNSKIDDINKKDGRPTNKSKGKSLSDDGEKTLDNEKNLKY